MSAKRLQALAESGEDLHDLLGDSSYSVVEFYKRVEEGLVPRIMQALSGAHFWSITCQPEHSRPHVHCWQGLADNATYSADDPVHVMPQNTWLVS